ncbi:MAG: maleylpyruvate isomerase family mycothiol-dependent enzyme [Actinomycetota bacterium]|jgi:uncharacterized protein (TIGR03083 family)|nr:maleylpyruvate isomerase family mycothiol-dependent enzyme [Actinomycetota bacterium]
MQVAEHIDALERDGKHLVSVARASDLDLPVPSCPGWRLADLLAHIGFVHHWAASYVSHGWTEMVPEKDEQEIFGTAPGPAQLLGWAEEGHAGLVAALREAPGDLRCWTFLPAPSPLAFWARRQAHETAVHRADAELARSGAVTAFEPAFAADGIDELLFGFLAKRRRQGDEGAPGGSMVLEATDFAASWTVRIGAEGVTALEGDHGGDVSVSATASDLYLFTWNRRGAEGQEVSGNRDVIKRWQESARVRWA